MKVLQIQNFAILSAVPLFSCKVEVAGAEVVAAGGGGEGGTEVVEVEGEVTGMTAGRRSPLQRLWC